jgi:hypothetical protein
VTTNLRTVAYVVISGQGWEERSTVHRATLTALTDFAKTAALRAVGRAHDAVPPPREPCPVCLAAMGGVCHRCATGSAPDTAPSKGIAVNHYQDGEWSPSDVQTTEARGYDLRDASWTHATPDDIMKAFSLPLPFKKLVDGADPALAATRFSVQFHPNKQCGPSITMITDGPAGRRSQAWVPGQDTGVPTGVPKNVFKLARVLDTVLMNHRGPADRHDLRSVATALTTSCPGWAMCVDGGTTGPKPYTFTLRHVSAL